MGEARAMSVELALLAQHLAELKERAGDLYRALRVGIEDNYTAKLPLAAERYLGAAGIMHQVEHQVATVQLLVLGAEIAGDWQPSAELLEAVPHTDEGTAAAALVKVHQRWRGDRAERFRRR
jgi:hypothetical protein